MNRQCYTVAIGMHVLCEDWMLKAMTDQVKRTHLTNVLIHTGSIPHDPECISALFGTRVQHKLNSSLQSCIATCVLYTLTWCSYGILFMMIKTIGLCVSCSCICVTIEGSKDSIHVSCLLFTLLALFRCPCISKHHSQHDCCTGSRVSLHDVCSIEFERIGVAAQAYGRLAGVLQSSAVLM